MTDDATTPPAGLPPDPIVAAATKAVSSMFETVLATLTTDIQKMVENSEKPNPLAPVIQNLTTDMIKILNERVKSTLSGGGS